MNQKYSLPAILIASSVLIMNGCTNPTTEAGSVNTFYDGTITDIEPIDMDNKQQDSTTNAVMGAVAGAIVGNMINGHTTGTLVGAGAGLLAGKGVSMLADRTDGVRMTVETENGPMIIDMPFSCKYGIGKKVRIVSGSSNGSIMVEEDGHYVTATKDSKSKCPAVFEKKKAE
jgi:outer membrane lipoprotein SlyB